MRVVKRNGDIEAFDQAKIRNAISKANHESSKKLTGSMIDNIVKRLLIQFAILIQSMILIE